MEIIQEYLPIIAQVLGYITIGATIVVRLTPNKEDDLKAEKIISKVWKYINMLPTIGVNPRTKKLEEAYKDMKK
jgi:hypothetical protein